MKGKINGIVNHGSIVMVYVRTRKGISSIPFDHRPFFNMVEVEGDLMNRKIDYDETEKMIYFLN